MGHSSPVVLISGCSTGIGRALAEEFHRNHGVVYATARAPERIAELKAQGMLALSLDITDTKSIQAAVTAIEKEQGRLDILINNAGYAAIGPLAEMPLEQLRLQFETNVLGHMALLRAALPLLLESDAPLVVNIGSVSGILVTPFAGAYCATKAAMHALSAALRMELAPFGIRVITVQPGAIESNFGRRAETEIATNLPPDSRYRPALDGIRARANASQDNPTSAAEFARKLVAELTRPEPKAVIRLGKGSFLLPFMQRWVPRPVLDRILSKKFHLTRLLRAAD